MVNATFAVEEVVCSTGVQGVVQLVRRDDGLLRLLVQERIRGAIGRRVATNELVTVMVL